MGLKKKILWGLHSFGITFEPMASIINYISPIKGVLHPRPVFWLFMQFSQKLQHIGNK